MVKIHFYQMQVPKYIFKWFFPKLHFPTNPWPLKGILLSVETQGLEVCKPNIVIVIVFIFKHKIQNNNVW